MRKIWIWFRAGSKVYLFTLYVRRYRLLILQSGIAAAVSTTKRLYENNPAILSQIQVPSCLWHIITVKSAKLNNSFFFNNNSDQLIKHLA